MTPGRRVDHHHRPGFTEPFREVVSEGVGRITEEVVRVAPEVAAPILATLSLVGAAAAAGPLLHSPLVMLGAAVAAAVGGVLVKDGVKEALQRGRPTEIEAKMDELRAEVERLRAGQSETRRRVERLSAEQHTARREIDQLAEWRSASLEDRWTSWLRSHRSAQSVHGRRPPQSIHGQGLSRAPQRRSADTMER